MPRLEPRLPTSLRPNQANRTDLVILLRSIKEGDPLLLGIDLDLDLWWDRDWDLDWDDPDLDLDDRLELLLE